MDGTFFISKNLHVSTQFNRVSQFVYTMSRFSSIMVFAIFKTNLLEDGIKIGF